MPIRDLILKVKEGWPDYRSKRFTNRNNETYKIVVGEFPEFLKSISPHRDLYEFVGSTGQGNITAAPWVAALYKSLTTSSTKEFYLVYLFSVDMKSIYLSIAFGVTDFENKFGKGMFSKMREGARRLQGLHPDLQKKFIKEEINLGASRQFKLHFCYQKSNIYALKYEISDLPEEKQLEQDFCEMIEHYRDMAINEMIIPTEEMVEEISGNEQLRYKFTSPRLLQPSEMPSAYKTQGAIPKINPKTINRRSRQSKRVGDRGEEFVLLNEREELKNAGRGDLAEKVKLVASENRGWDITSYDSNGTIKYIEVKSTSAKKINSIEITVNEWNQASDPTLAKNYYIYLVTETLTEAPQISYMPIPLDWIKNKRAEIYPIVFRIEF